MIDEKYYKGFEGEGAVKIWSEENGEEVGLVIWIGYFDTILEGCFYPEYKKNGIIECYNNRDGFYDDKWKMKYPNIVLEELERFNEKKLDTIEEYFIEKDKEVLNELVSFINNSIGNENSIYIEYE